MALKLLNMPEFKGTDLIADDIEAMAEMSAAIKALFPVGAIYISVNSRNPGDFIGGEWEAIGGGRVLVTPGFSSFHYEGDQSVQERSDAGTAGQTGGQARHTHLTPVGFDDNSIYFVVSNTGGEMRVPTFNSALKYNQAGITVWDNLTKFYNDTARMAYTRENSNYPPYFTAFMWRRVR